MEKFPDSSDSEAEVVGLSNPQDTCSQPPVNQSKRKCCSDCEVRIRNLEARMDKLEHCVYAHLEGSRGNFKEKSDEDDIMMLPAPKSNALNSGIDDTFYVLSPRTQNPYCEEDRKLIVKYLIDNGLEGCTGVNSGIWHRMAKDVTFRFSHTHQSLENHFRKVVRPNLANYVKDGADRKKFENVDSPRKKKKIA